MADLEELHEHAEHGAAKNMAPVTVSMAVLAVIVACVSLLGERVHANEMLAQTVETDQWSQYQAEKIRQRSYMMLLDELNVFSLQPGAKVDDIRKKYQSEIDKYTKETKDLSDQATGTEATVRMYERRSNWFDFAAGLLESSLVICSITLLTEKKHYWYLGLLIGASGLVITVIGLFIH